MDFTVGGGGHFFPILERLGTSGRALGVDRDLSAVEQVRRRIKEKVTANARVVHAKFSEMEDVLRRFRFILFDLGIFDLGISSMQIADAQRGFSFMSEGQLNMQMGRDSKTAFQVVNGFSEAQLRTVFKTYGEEPLGGRIARVIIRTREREPINTTLKLVEAIDKAISPQKRRQRNKILARIFQSLRIYVNDELSELESGLKTAIRHLSIGGRLGVISYHSLEDRIVKRTFKFYSKKGTAEEPWVLIPLTKKPVYPTPEELLQNRRARSAKLRVVRKSHEGRFTYGS